MNSLPIFVVSFNRGRYLRMIIDSYRRQDMPVSIVIHDNGSDELNTVLVLAELEAEGCSIYRNSKIMYADELNLVDSTVQDYVSRSNYQGPFAVTDCDVDLSAARPDALRLYLELLDLYTDIDCVGPMLRIVDVPKSYPLFNRLMQRHIEQFWASEPEWVETSLGRIAILRHVIDTTFAIHRAGSTFRRLKPGVRVYHPFEARHLDWYMGELANGAYRATSSGLIAHWDNVTEFERFSAFECVQLPYITVEGALPNLVLRNQSTADNPA